MQIYNTLTRKKEEFIPQTPGEYRIYVCGPTVYNYIHIGNARPVVVFDTLRRYLEYRGNKVYFVSNITDIDDKLIKKAQEQGCSMKEVAEKFEAEFIKDSDGLNAKTPTVRPRATEHIEEILDIVKDILDKGYGYVAKNGDVYFRTRAFKEYGKLSHLNLEELESGNRELRSQMDDDLKEDPADFAVWKAAKPGEPAWPSPYGPGRPGWHIECSAMARKHLGNTIDLHCGGQDLIFPHHENEIALAGLTAVPGQKVAAPAIAQLPLTLECKVLYRQHQEAAAIPPAIREKYHPQDVEPDFHGRNRDFHTAYYGEIVSAYILE